MLFCRDYVCIFKEFLLLRGTSSSNLEDRCTPSGASRCSSTVSGSASGSKIGAGASGEDGGRACGEEGPFPGWEAYSSARRETDPYHDRETRAGAGYQTVPHQNTRVQDDLSPREEALKFLES